MGEMAEYYMEQELIESMNENQIIETETALTVPEPKALGMAIAHQQPVTVDVAQAKVNAVANLTMKAYERASMLALTETEVAALQAEFPDEAFKSGAAGKENLIYIEHAYLRDRLNQVFGPGQWSIIPRSRWAEDFKTEKGQAASRVYVEAMLVIRGCFVAEAVGDMVYYPHNQSQNYGDAVEGAKTAALRRCAKELGIGLQAWKKDFCEGWWKRRATAKPTTIVAKPAAAPAPKPTAPAPVPKVDLTPIKPETQSALIEKFGTMLGIGAEYLVSLGWILPTEGLEALREDRAQRILKGWDKFTASIDAWLQKGGNADDAVEPPKAPVDAPSLPQDAPEAPAPSPDTNTVSGIVEAVSEKPGTGKNNKPYVKYGVKIAGSWYNTFDKVIAEACKAKRGEEISIFTKTTKWGNEITGLN